MKIDHKIALCYIYKKRFIRFNQTDQMQYLKKMISSLTDGSTGFITGLNNCNRFIKMLQPYPNRLKPV